ncbi:acetate kinase [candidate division KSB1 bacterium]|nr:acetate kinase [candidate division KSB1 bacterium]
MNILVLNCGSSSIKFQLINMDDESVVAKGQIERIGATDAILKYKPVMDGKKNITEIRTIQDHNEAISLVINTLLDKKNGVIQDKSDIDGIGHRIVHGGEEFIESVLITEEVKEGVKRCIQFAPLHNPHNLKGIEVCEEQLPGIPQVGVFDTAFHHTLPPKAHIYAIPLEFYHYDRIRRYGFHGTSHAYVARMAAKYVNRPIEELKIITCHLGNGSSITAVDGGKSVETSMGFTPLEGLVMGTRSGDIDPALIIHLARLKNLPLPQVDALLNKKSGMYGLTEGKSDFRDIEDEAMAGNEKFIQALDIFCHRLKKYIGAYAAILDGLDILVFTAGIGERSSYCRNIILSGMGYLGISFDPEKNERNEYDIGTGPTKVLVIPTNEELAIAQDAKKILESLPVTI